jgi:hypothetical protein
MTAIKLIGQPALAWWLAARVFAMPAIAVDMAVLLSVLPTGTGPSMLAEFYGGSQSIAAATQQIAAGNLDLSKRTEEQAASLEQTAAAMDELTSTVQLNAENAQDASRLAGDASDMTGRGREAVGSLVETMHAIDAGASKMTGIITAIEGIAFPDQHPSAERGRRSGARRRGRARLRGGRGRGAQPRATVGGCGEGNRLADCRLDGARRARRTDRDGRGRYDSRNRSGDLECHEDRRRDCDGFAAAEQRHKGRVSLAVTQMDEVTQQNAALVEENAATAASLADEAKRLSELAAAFRVAGDAALG